MLSDDELYAIFEPHVWHDKHDRDVEPDSDFNLEMLVGREIVNSRSLLNKQIDPSFGCANPYGFRVIEFKDGSILLSENWGDGECGHLNFYFYDKERMYFSSRLFSVDR